jgi:hypothetical protein
VSCAAGRLNIRRVPAGTGRVPYELAPQSRGPGTGTRWSLPRPSCGYSYSGCKVEGGVDGKSGSEITWVRYDQQGKEWREGRGERETDKLETKPAPLCMGRAQQRTLEMVVGDPGWIRECHPPSNLALHLPPASIRNDLHTYSSKLYTRHTNLGR